jgi:small subunit ribosomal protein S16
MSRVRVGTADRAMSLVGSVTQTWELYMVRIRLRRIGRKKAPVYRIVVADSTSPRDGKFIEVIGQYAPRQSEGGLNINEERANYWMTVGAQPSDTVRSLLRRAGVLKRRHESRIGRTPAVVAAPEQPDLTNVIPVLEQRTEEEA